MRLDHFMRHGEMFSIRRGSQEHEAKGLKNGDRAGRRYIGFYPGTDVQKGDLLHGAVSGNKWRVTDVETSLMHGRVFQIKAYIDPPPQHERHAPMGIHVGSMVNSAIQQGSPGAIQSIAVTQQNRENIAEVLDALTSTMDQLGLRDQARSDLCAEIDTIKGQLKLSQPKGTILSACFNGIKDILQASVEAAATTAASVAASGLIERITLLLDKSF